MQLWFIGVALSLLGCTLSNSGVTLQKKSHLVLAERGDPDASYITNPWWICGMGCVILGSIADLVSYGFADMTLLAPLGAMTLVVNLFFAPCFLKETLTRRDIFCTITILGGTILSIIFGSKESRSFTITELTDAYLRAPFIVFGSGFIIYMIVSLIVLSHINRKDKAGTITPPEARVRSILYPSDAGAWGALSVLFAKTVAEVIKNSINGENNWDNPFVYVSFVLMFSALITQTKLLNGGLAYADALLIVPVYQTFWVIMNVVAGMVYFQDYKNLDSKQLFLFCLGVVITVVGVYFLSQRTAKDQLIEEEVEVDAGAAPAVAIVKSDSGSDIQVSKLPSGPSVTSPSLVASDSSTAMPPLEQHVSFERIDKVGHTTTTSLSTTSSAASLPSSASAPPPLKSSESRVPLTINEHGTHTTDIKISVIDTSSSTASLPTVPLVVGPVPVPEQHPADNTHPTVATSPKLTLTLLPTNPAFASAPGQSSAVSPALMLATSTITSPQPHFDTLTTPNIEPPPTRPTSGSRVLPTPRPTKVRRPTLMSFFAPTVLDITPLATPSARPSSRSVQIGSLSPGKRSSQTAVGMNEKRPLSPPSARMQSQSVCVAQEARSPGGGVISREGSEKHARSHSKVECKLDERKEAGGRDRARTEDIKLEIPADGQQKQKGAAVSASSPGAGKKLKSVAEKEKPEKERSKEKASALVKEEGDKQSLKESLLKSEDPAPVVSEPPTRALAESPNH